MNTTQEREHPAPAPRIEARTKFMDMEGAPFLLADWDRALFIHFAIEPDDLQPCVPFELDLFEGQAFVSLVAFTMRRMRLGRGGRLASWICAPVAEQRFLNLRTYVRHGAECGIYFITEWISHWMCLQLGSLLYGLPYRWGRLNFRHEPEHGIVRGRVEARDGPAALSYRVSPRDALWRLATCAPGSLNEFLLERYIAFTRQGATRRFFRVRHKLWQQTPVEVELCEETLLSQALPWCQVTPPVSANYSPGTVGVSMGRPRLLDSR